MPKPFVLQVAELCHGTRIIGTENIKGPGNTETFIWGLANHKSIVIRAHRRHTGGRDVPVFDTVELDKRSFTRAVKETRDQYEKIASGAMLSLEVPR